MKKFTLLLATAWSVFSMSSCVICQPPAALTATSITPNSANLGFTSTTGLWQVEYGAPGFTQGTGTSAFTTTNPYPAAGLTPSTAYTFYARSICGAGDTSVWAGPSAFTTPCGGVPVVAFTNAARCDSGSVTLTATTSLGAVIRWYSGASGGAPLVTGGSYTTPTLTATTTYYVEAENACGISTRQPVTATINPIPVMKLKDTSFCESGSLTLNAGNPGCTYLWNNNATTQSITVTAGGTYTVTITTPAGCVKTDQAVVTMLPRPVVDLGPDTAICPELAIDLTLDAGNPGAGYLWDNGSTAQTRHVTAAGNYSVTVKAINGCSRTDNINVSLKDEPSVTGINAVYGDGVYTFNALNAQFVSEFTWDFGDGTPPVVGDVVQHTYAANGIYYVSVDLTGQCEGLSDKFTVSVDVFGATGIGKINLKANELVLYPNPARELLTIENKSGLSMKRLTVYNILGQLVQSSGADSPLKHQLNIAGLAQGTYTLKIETEKGFVTRKFQVNR